MLEGVSFKQEAVAKRCRLCHEHMDTGLLNKGQHVLFMRQTDG